MNYKLLFFFFALLFSQIMYAQPVTLTNTDNTITIASPWGCLPAGSASGGPSVTGNYIIRIDWYDIGTASNEFYQTPTASPDLVTINNFGLSTQSVVLNALASSGFSNPIHFPDFTNEGYSFLDIQDLTITVKTLNLSTTWIIKFSEGVKNEQCVVLPINLLSFYGQKVYNANAAQLYWQTAQESNMSRFEVERSSDGVYFQTIGATIPATNTSITQNYTYTDNIPAGTRQYYRLRMIDNDGRRTYTLITTVQGLTAVAQPGSIACNYTMGGPSALCTYSTAGYGLSFYPDFSNVIWTATPFFNIPNSYKLYADNGVPGGARLTVINPNVITLTSTVSRCSSGGTIVRYIFKGKPAISKSTTTRNVTDPCTGVIISSSATVTVTPFPGTAAGDYQWYINNVYSSTGLSKTFNTSAGSPGYSYEIRFNGPCGLSIGTGIISGSGGIPIDFAKIAPNPITSNLRIDSRRPPCDPIPSPSNPLVSNIKVNMITGYEIFDYSGNRVKFQELKIPIDLLDVNVQNLQRGNYRLIIHYGELSENEQIKLVD
jgi:hypothetical protein